MSNEKSPEQGGGSREPTNNEGQRESADNGELIRGGDVGGEVGSKPVNTYYTPTVPTRPTRPPKDDS